MIARDPQMVGIRPTSKISILMAAYNELCMEVMNDPEKRGRGLIG